MTPEGRVKAAIKKWLKEQGAYFFMPVQTGYGAVTLDFLVCWRGKFVAIEAKREKGGKVSPRQSLVIDQIREAHGAAFVASSLDEVKERLELL